MKFLLMVLVCMAILPKALAGAESLDVSAIVPYTVPTIPATILSPLNGFSTQSASVTVSGTCEYIAPSTAVVLVRNGSVVGSTNCSIIGSYSLVIALVSGQNQLIARTANANSLYGPDSLAVNMQYNVPSAPPSNTSTTESVPRALTLPSDLSLTADIPFYVLTRQLKTVSISVQVSGGVTPYTVEINWGDGTTEARKVDVPGLYTFTYEYVKDGVYQAKATVTDVRGVSRQYTFTVISSSPDVLPATSQDKDAKILQGNDSQLWWWVWWLILPLFVLCFTLGLFIGSRWLAAGKRKKRKKKS
jgi:hypothetical protein